MSVIDQVAEVVGSRDVAEQVVAIVRNAQLQGARQANADRPRVDGPALAAAIVSTYGSMLAAEKAGVIRHEVVGRWKSGRVNPDLWVADRVCTAIGRHIGEFLL